MFRSRVKGKFWTRLKRCCVSVLYDTVYCQQIVRGCERGSVYVPRSVQINDPEQKLLGEIYLAYE